jgi:hypothetical protein
LVPGFLKLFAAGEEVRGTTCPELRCVPNYMSKDAGWGMTPADHYRVLAAQFMARAKSEQNLKLRSEWQYLSICYLRLAEQADRNGQTDVVYEPPPKGSGVEKTK